MAASSTAALLLKLSLSLLFLAVSGIEEAPCFSGEDGCHAEMEAVTLAEASSMKASLLQIRTPKETKDVAMLGTEWKNDTCKGMCGRPFIKQRSCQCNNDCHKHKSCCADYEDECAAGEGVHKDTCKGMCGRPFNKHWSCQCSNNCNKYKNCCADYEDECAAGEEADNFTGKRLNLFMFNPHGECFMPWAKVCTKMMQTFTDKIFNHTHIDFATLAYTSGKYFPPKGWGFFNHTCHGQHIDDIMMAYNEEKWTPIDSAPKTAIPTAAPTVEPAAAPTDEPTAAPTDEPTAAPTDEPTAAPTDEPTAEPTASSKSGAKENATENASSTSGVKHNVTTRGKRVGAITSQERDKAITLHASGGESGCMDKRGHSLTRPYFVQAFESKETKERVVIVSGHFSHSYNSYGLKFLVSSIETIQKHVGTDKVIMIADTNMRASSYTKSAKVMDRLGAMRRRSIAQTTKTLPTCCARHMSIIGYDRIMANFGKKMKTVLPLKRAPKWSKNNFHLPLLGFLDY